MKKYLFLLLFFCSCWSPAPKEQSAIILEKNFDVGNQGETLHDKKIYSPTGAKYSFSIITEESDVILVPVTQDEFFSFALGERIIYSSDSFIHKIRKKDEK